MIVSDITEIGRTNDLATTELFKTYVTAQSPEDDVTSITFLAPRLVKYHLGQRLQITVDKQ